MPVRPIVPEDDLYARLEVPRDATFEAIEIAWRALLKRHHPDVAGSDGLELAKRINIAHDWLGDPHLRARYDEERYHGVHRHRTYGGGAAPANARGPAHVRRPAPLTTAEALRRVLLPRGAAGRREAHPP